MGPSVKKGARGAAFDVLNRVEGGDAYADILLEREINLLDEADAHLTTEITMGVLRFRLRLDWIIGQFSSIKVKKLEHGVLNALRIGAYQLLFLTRVPASAAVNESVKLIKPFGQKKAGFVNAVLRKIDALRNDIAYPPLETDPVRHISVVYSHPEWIVKRWIERWGVDETAALCRAGLEVPPKKLRVNTLLTTREALLEELAASGMEVREASFSPECIDVLKGRPIATDRRYYIQDEASQLIAHLVAPSPGERILDACSAPGGKTTHLAQLMCNRGEVYALDRRPARLRTVKETAERLGESIIKTVAADAGEPLPFTEGALFDAILCDAPCSGLGVVRRSPDIKYRRKEEDITDLSELQKKILGNLSGYLKKGGRLVYSTCTFEPEETDEVVKWFLGSHRDFKVEGARGYVPEDCQALVDEPGYLRTYPHRHGLDGFFAVRLKKT